MSAIWGAISTNEINTTYISEEMSKVYNTRCKLDDIRNYNDAHLTFSCGLQYITSESKIEVLPTQDKSTGVLLTADCILSNREALLHALSLTDTSLPDGALLLQLYLLFGIDFLKKIEGLFTVAIWDPRSEHFYLATDQLSQRCMYYCEHKEILYFSTLIDPIRRVCPDIICNELYLKDFLLAPGLIPNITPGETPYQAIYQLLPGHYLCFHKGCLTKRCYWRFSDYCKSQKPKHALACKEQFLSIFKDCVNSALRTDTEVSICLSSGFDSSSIGSLAALALKEKDKSLYTYTYVPHEVPPNKQVDYFIMDETALVKELADLYPNMKQTFLCNKGKNCVEDLDTLSQILEIPFKAVANFPNLYEIYNQAYANGSRVVLSGQFGNSTISYGDIQNVLFDLYDRKKYLTFLSYINGYCTRVVPQGRKKAITEFLAYCKHTKKEYQKPFHLTKHIDNPFLSPEILEGYPFSQRFSSISSLCQYKGLPENNALRQKQLELPNSYLYIGAYETKLGLSTGVVIRDPTRDLRMIRFCTSIPFEYFAYKGEVRWLIRGAMKEFLPNSYTSVWPRYGLQNSDCELRILRDWHTLRPKFASLCEATDQNKYFNEEALNTFISYVDSYIDSTEEYNEKLELGLTYILFLLSYVAFRSNHSL